MLSHSNTDLKNILLTGVTGVVGGRLLFEILTTTDANVYCLIREADEQHALSRIKTILSVYDQEKQCESDIHRIIPVLGDVSEKYLGMANTLYHDLTGKIDSVIHCAANVKLLSSYAKIAPTNVQGTHNIIEFCLSGGAPLLYTSSFSIIGSRLFQQGFVMHETDLDVGQKFDGMGYELTKFEAEQAIHSAGEQGLKWVIVRPGNVWGDSHSGCYPLYQTRVKGVYYDVIKSLVETGLTYDSPEDFEITPVDYVAKASLFAISYIQKFDRKTLHLVNQTTINFNQFVACLREFGYRIRTIDNNDFIQAVLQKRIYRNGEPYNSVYMDLLSVFYSKGIISERAKYATQLTTELLSGSGIQCAPSGGELISCYLNYLIEQQFILAPQDQGEGAEII
ncbi:NAD-dependent epimerase/dehydratase family protein [Xenorhabdus sp. 12]|uniref:NAD-dependent epimerase/dehydratase family protein n=1 Tax=Xenorhabdus santafensis TaxID=2582833 RepID=A0ABU4SCL8_9GAMM|nr:thioester reductase domain-containing protein [Xenorhabdus sp. 12]MDX7988466.1 NAD-dependent epimerase/dehydratase family protein [Xenorhabdus sp. 12]